MMLFNDEIVASLAAVNIEPPVTDEIFLVEQSAVGTEKTVLGQISVSEVDADLE